MHLLCETAPLLFFPLKVKKVTVLFKSVLTESAVVFVAFVALIDIDTDISTLTVLNNI